jgi:CRISP-associated protein Cas1
MVEAQAAQRYFPLFFGDAFRRDRDANGVNALLNYGYTVLRAATARAIVACGLSPSLSLCHGSKGDALRLADDLMEPFRPTVDLVVNACREDGKLDLEPEVKRRIAAVLTHDFRSETGIGPLTNAITRLAQSLSNTFDGKTNALAFPNPLVPSQSRDSSFD